MIVTRDTRCSICGLGFGQVSTEAVIFPDMPMNEMDPLHVFNDAAVHSSCLAAHPLTTKARSLLVHAARRGPCAACGLAVTDAKPFFETWVLSSDDSDPLAAFNFLVVHEEHFSEWMEAARFESAVGANMGVDRWRGPLIEFVPWPRWVRDSAGRQRVVRVVAGDGD